MLEMAFYWSLFFTQFSDVKRKDFMEMFIHHLATLALLTLSWTMQMFRKDLGPVPDPKILLLKMSH